MITPSMKTIEHGCTITYQHFHVCFQTDLPAVVFDVDVFHLNRLSSCDAVDMPVLNGQAERHHIATTDADELVPTCSRVAEEGAIESLVGEGT